MAVTVNTNLASMSAQRFMAKNTSAVNNSLEKLASGLRINKGADDAAGLQIAETLATSVRGSQVAMNNVQDGMNVLNIQDGALASIGENLQRMRELTVQAANDSNTTAQRAAIELEVGQLAAEITRVSDNTAFNGTKLLNGSATSYILQVGASSTDTLNIATTVTTTSVFGDIDATALGVNALNYDTASSATITGYLATIDTAIQQVGTRRGATGTLYNRLDNINSNLQLASENYAAAESRIRDLDIASEAANLTKNQILQQASASVLSQANASGSFALSLIG